MHDILMNYVGKEMWNNCKTIIIIITPIMKLQVSETLSIHGWEQLGANF